MKLSWLFGTTMEQHHLLYVYLSVWLIQGGYAIWIAWKWTSTRRNLPPAATPSQESRKLP